MKEDKQTTNTTTEPWGPAIPLLTSLLSKYGALNTDPTSGQLSALQGLQTAIGKLPDFSGQMFDSIGDLFSTNVTPQLNMVGSAYDALRRRLGGIANGAELDPYLTPGFSDAIDAMSGDITDRIKSIYAASGRDPSGAGSFAGSLGRGLTEGIAPTIMAQFNANRDDQMSAANTLYGAGNTTAGQITGLNQLPLQNAAMGMGLIPGAMQTALMPDNLAFGAANTAYGLPFANLAQLLQPGVALGSMGGSSSSVTSAPQSMLSNIMGGLMGGTGILSQMGAFGSGGWLTPMFAGMFSDADLKDDVEQVGELYDGQPVVRFKYKGEGMPRIGLIAQEVERFAPDAVRFAGGFRVVDHGRATERAAEIGRMAA